MGGSHAEGFKNKQQQQVNNNRVTDAGSNVGGAGAGALGGDFQEVNRKLDQEYNATVDDMMHE